MKTFPINVVTTLFIPVTVIQANVGKWLSKILKTISTVSDGHILNITIRLRSLDASRTTQILSEKEYVVHVNVVSSPFSI